MPRTNRRRFLTAASGTVSGIVLANCATTKRIGKRVKAEQEGTGRLEAPGEMVDVPAKRIPIIAEADVVVVGGGTSGFIAATAAARTGAKTILVERFGYLGGCTTAPYNTMTGFFSDSNGHLIIRGLPFEFLERMKRDGQCLLNSSNGGNQLWPVWTRKVAIDMVSEAGVDLFLHTWTSDVLKDHDVVKGIIVETKGGRAVIRGKTFVDASGDADVAALAGAPFEMTNVDDLQQVSCDYLACGVNAGRVVEWARANRDKLTYQFGLDEEHKPSGVQPMLMLTIPNSETRGGWTPTVKLCIYREAVRIQGNVEVNPLDPKGLTYAEVEGLRGALAHLKYLQQTIPGFEDAFVAAPSHLGVRETRRITGDYVITIDDINGQARFKDVVALNCRALDYHLKGTVFKLEWVKGHHDVPLRALLPQGTANVLVVGRSISCDHLAQASLRGAGTCMATGHAGGTTAALAAKANGRIRELDTDLIHKTLLAQGAILKAGETA